MTKETLRAWYQASRPPFFVATLIPLTLGGVVAQVDGAWHTARWVVVLVSCFLVHLCTNLSNDYFDYTAGTDSGEAIGGSRVIQEGKIAPHEIRSALIILYGFALILGLWIVWDSGVWWLAGVMAFSFLSSLFYTAPPVRYGYRGLGEVFVALNMGPVMVAGTASALAGHFVPRAFWLSIPVGLMVALILYYQSLPDIIDDESVGKQTVAVRLGKPAAVWGFRFLVAATLMSIAVLVLFGLVDPVALVALLAVVPAYKIDRMICSTEDWKDLHDRGGSVRMLYMGIGLSLVLTVAYLG